MERRSPLRPFDRGTGAGVLAHGLIDVTVIASALRALRAPVRDGENFLTSAGHTETT
jgi:hypothetical protein